MPLLHHRAERWSHGPHPNSQYPVPEIGKPSAYQANREGVAERFTEPAVPKTSKGELALIPYDDELVRDLALSLTHTATHHAAPTFYRLQTVPGLGPILRLGLLDDIHPSERFPRVQDFASSCRLVTCAKASGGKRLGTSGNKIGTAPLQGALSEAAALFLRHNEPGQKLLARVENKPDQGKALSILAQHRGRAGSDRLKRKVAFAMDICLRTSGSRAAEPGASLDTHGDEPGGSTRDV